MNMVMFFCSLLAIAFFVGLLLRITTGFGGIIGIGIDSFI